MTGNRTLRILAVATGLIVPALTQASLITNLGVIARGGDIAPGVPGNDVPWTTSPFSDVAPVIDADGRVYFSGQMAAGTAGITYASTTITANLNDRGHWSGTSDSDVALVHRDGDAAPGTSAGVVFTRTLSTSTGSAFRFATLKSAGTRVLVGSDLNGTGVTFNVNDSALFLGNQSGYTAFLRRGASTPGISGGTFNDAYRSVSASALSMNTSGDVAVKVTVAGLSPAVDTTNNAAIYKYTSGGGLAMVMRKGMALDTGTLDIKFNVKLNNAGAVGYDGTLVGAGYTSANNSVLMIGTTKVYQNGTSTLPGGATLSGSPTLGNLGFTNAGFIFSTALTGGDVTTGVNDQATFKATTSGLQMVMRKGDSTGLPDGSTLGNINNTSVEMNDAGDVTFGNALALGGAVTTANDQTYWFKPAGGPLALVAREGDAAPGTGGAVFGNLNISQNNQLNASGEMLVSVAFTQGVGGTVAANDTALYGYIPNVGLIPIFREGDTFDAGGSLGVRTISNWLVSATDSGSGASTGFNDAGSFAVRLNFVEGGSIIATGTVPEPASMSLIALGAAAVLRRRR